nr:CP20k-like protein 1 isoform 1 [Capitulum mitella]
MMKTTRVLLLFFVVVAAISATAEAHEDHECNNKTKCWNCITKDGKEDCNCDCNRMKCDDKHPCYHCYKDANGKMHFDCDCHHIKCDKRHACYHCHCKGKSCDDCHCDCTHSPN